MGRSVTLADLHHAIIENAIERVQPIMMPVVAITIAGLISVQEQRRSLRDHAGYRRADDRWHGFFALMTLVAISAIQAPSRDRGRCQYCSGTIGACCQQLVAE